MSDSLQPHGLYSPWNSPGQNTGVGSLSLLQGIFPTQGSNPGPLHYRWIRYQLSHKGSPRTLEWVAYPFSSASSQPRNQTRVSCIVGEFFTNWVIREVHISLNYTTIIKFCTKHFPSSYIWHKNIKCRLNIIFIYTLYIVCLIQCLYKNDKLSVV